MITYPIEQKKVKNKVQTIKRHFNNHKEEIKSITESQVVSLIASEKIEKVKNQLTKQIEDLENKLETIQQVYINKLNSDFNTFKRGFIKADIRVVEDDGTWGSYSGIFKASRFDSERIVYKKAKEHYNNHFKNGEWYANKTLGLFITDKDGSRLVEVLKDKGNKIKEK